MASGAGAWQVPKVYQRGVGDSGANRISWAVKAIQNELCRQGIYPCELGRGHYGPTTALCVGIFQRRWGLRDTKEFGPPEARRLWLDWFAWWQAALAIPHNLLYGKARLESAMDPGAEGSFDSDDRGMLQFSRKWNPQISDETAYSDVPFCIAEAGHRMRAAFDTFFPIVDERLRTQATPQQSIDKAWAIAVAHHNNPSKAKKWAETGEADEQIRNYVAVVFKCAGLPL